MTVVSLVAAVTVGLLAGLAGLASAQVRRSVPVWLPVAIGVGAAMLATLALQMAAPGRTGLTGTELVLQIVFAVAAVALVAVTGGRRSPVTRARCRDDRTEGLR